MLVEIAMQSWGVAARRRSDGSLLVQAGLTPAISDLYGGAVTIYSENDPSSTPIAPADWKTAGDGTLPGYIEIGAYLYTEPIDGTVRLVEAVAGRPKGVDATDVGYDIFVLAGQSNMRGPGTATPDPHLDPADERILQFASQGTYANVISQALDPLGHHQVATGVGPGIPFARWYDRATPQNRLPLLVPVAHGDTGFGLSTSYTWKPGGTPANSPFENLYEFALEQTLAALEAAGENSRLCGILWVQGENDAASLALANAYEGNLDEMVDGFRDDLDEPDLPFVIGQMVPEGAPTYFATVNAAQIDAPRRKTRTAFAYGPFNAYAAPGPESLHYSDVGIRTLGHSMHDAYRRSLLNVLGGAPLAPLEVTLTQVIDTVEISWPQPLGRVTDYLPRYRLGTSGAWTDITHTIPLDTSGEITGLSIGETYQVEVATVNEEGTSEYTQATVTLVAAPGQATGLAAGVATSTTQRLTCTATPTATEYLWEYKESADPTWLESPTTAAPAATVRGLKTYTEYDYRVTAINPGGSAPVSATVTATTATFTAIITDVGVAAWRAYGLRKLVDAYAGSAIKVSRASDGTELDIGFTAPGVLDEAALLTFVGAGDASVKTWYDQSGNAYHLTQATVSAQPSIVTGGVINKENDQPTIAFNGIQHYFSDSTVGLYSATGASLLTVFRQVAGAATPGLSLAAEVSHLINTQRYRPFSFPAVNGSSIRYEYVRDDNTLVIQSAFVPSSLIDELRQATVVDTAAVVTSRIDKQTIFNALTSLHSGTVTLTRFGVGAHPYGTVSNFTAMNLSELVLFTSALSATDYGSGEDNQRNFFTTT